MNEFNPYAAPVTDLNMPRATGESGVWRDGPLLVMSKEAELPDRCLKCNAPALGWRLKRNLSWHPQGYFVILLISPILYIIVALIVRKTAQIYAPLCPDHRRVRRRRIALAWIFSLLGPALAIAGGAGSEGVRGIAGEQVGTVFTIVLVVGGVVMLVAGLVLAVLASQVALPKKIDKRFVWLQKVSPDLVASLPSWLA